MVLSGRTIRERFGVESALDYLVGEKLLTFARAADEDPVFAAEPPRFQAAVWEIFNPYQLRGLYSQPQAFGQISS
jgi:hypothetical protein